MSMKKIIGLFIITVAAMTFVSCDPVENREVLKGATTMDKINQLVRVEQETRDGKRSNYFSFYCEGLDALSSFQYGIGRYVGTKAEGVKCFVVPGDVEILFTALNSDGTKLQRTFTFTVDECFDVEPEWELFCGTGSKTWTWDDGVDAPYGMGDALWSDEADWWAPDISDNIEGPGATMTFAANGSTLTKNKTDGSVEQGVFSFNMDEQHDDYSRSLGELTTSIPVLAGQTTGEDTGNGPDGKDVKVYEILTLTEGNMMLSWLEPDETPDTDGWGQATLWFFKAVE